MQKHVTIKLGEYDIPLIGIKPKLIELECDLCHNWKSIEDLELNDAGNQFLCLKCREENS